MTAIWRAVARELRLSWQYAKAATRMVSGSDDTVLRRAVMCLRFFLSWRLSLAGERNALVDEVPWVTFEANRTLASVLTSSTVVLEYGSGGSTLFFANRAKHVTSIEHDRDWWCAVKEVLASSRIWNCDLRLVEPEPAAVWNETRVSDPTSYMSSAYPGFDFRRYASAVDNFPDNYFDLVMVDGRARPSCVLHAMYKVKVGGYLVLDNSERSRYVEARRLLNGWENQAFFGPGPYGAEFWETAMWRRVGE